MSLDDVEIFRFTVSHYAVKSAAKMNLLYKPKEGRSSIIQSNLSYPNVDYPKLLGYSKTTDSPDFFHYYLLQ